MSERLGATHFRRPSARTIVWIVWGLLTVVGVYVGWRVGRSSSRRLGRYQLSQTELRAFYRAFVAGPDGEPIATARDLIRFLDTRTAVGQTIQVTVWRDGQEMTVPVTLDEQPQ